MSLSLHTKVDIISAKIISIYIDNNYIDDQRSHLARQTIRKAKAGT